MNNPPFSYLPSVHTTKTLPIDPCMSRPLPLTHWKQDQYRQNWHQYSCQTWLEYNPSWTSRSYKSVLQWCAARMFASKPYQENIHNHKDLHHARMLTLNNKLHSNVILIESRSYSLRIDFRWLFTYTSRVRVQYLVDQLPSARWKPRRTSKLCPIYLQVPGTMYQHFKFPGLCPLLCNACIHLAIFS